MSQNTIQNNSDDISRRLVLFGKYLDKSGMDHKEYQFDGVRWCLENELQVRNEEKDKEHDASKGDASKACNLVPNIRGGFIADEMGLGKTIMMIGVMLCHFVKRTLIVVPPVLLEQWNYQIYRTTGHKALIYHGINKKNITLEMLNNAIIVITTYGTISLGKTRSRTHRQEENEEKGGLLHQVEWSRIVYDEAHHLRNGKTVLFRGARMLKGQIHWLVSGTPIQNNIKDFYSLCSIMRLPASFYTDKKNITLFTKYFLLKRTKQQVGIAMPNLRIEKDVIGWKTLAELELSQNIHHIMYGAVREEKLFLMLLAKQSCIMSGLITKHMDKLKDFGDEFELKKENSSGYGYGSSKLDQAVTEILKKKGNGCGKLVFCHFREEIDEIQRRLYKGGYGLDSVAIFDGRLTSKKRQIVLAAGTEVLILQIQTGCEGLNLQENYSEIYFVSPHWNPSVEEQAIARCHRIGQTKPVFVKHFVMGNFVETDEQEEENEREEKHGEPEEKEILSLDSYVTVVQDRKRNLVNEIINN
jgi:SNF2 family DNA or RNA helicase